MHTVTIIENGNTRVEQLNNTDPNDSIAGCVYAFDPFQWRDKEVVDKFINSITIIGKAEEYGFDHDATLILAN